MGIYKNYELLFSKVAAKELRQLPNNELKRVFAKSKELENEPRIGRRKDIYNK